MAMAKKLKITGTWKGVLEEVDMNTWTVVKLREEVAVRSNCQPNAVNLIWAGKILKDYDEAQSLAQLGLNYKPKIFSFLTDPLTEEERARSRRLQRIREAARVISERNVDTFECFELDAEDQSGKIKCFMFGENRRVAIEGLALQTKAKRLIDEGNYEDALQVLLMAEEAFSFLPPEILLHLDNISILQVDIVWCYLMLRDIKWLSDARERLEKARKGIAQRVRKRDSYGIEELDPDHYPEIALVLRLDLLDGVVAYHDGQLENSKSALVDAGDNFNKMQMPVEALSRVKMLGFSEPDAKRALRIHDHDVEEAIDFLVEMKTKNVQKSTPREKIRKKKLYGKKSADAKKLKELMSMGKFLTKIEFNEIVQHGFERSKVAAAFETGGTLQEALRILAEQFPKGPCGSASSSTPSLDDASSSNIQDRDEEIEMEDQLCEDIAGTRIFKDYDREVFLEWEAITEYVFLILSAEKDFVE